MGLDAAEKRKQEVIIQRSSQSTCHLHGSMCHLLLKTLAFCHTSQG